MGHVRVMCNACHGCDLVPAADYHHVCLRYINYVKHARYDLVMQA
jgi:hypothetical protein